jgi:hypothetical protein
MTHHSLTSRRLVDMVDMEENKKKETKVRRTFDREFKNDAVRLVELSNRFVKQVAKELDILRSYPVQLDV